MLDNDITDVIDESFCTTISVLGKTDTVDLVANGRDKPVTQENKALFVQLKARAGENANGSLYSRFQNAPQCPLAREAVHADVPAVETR